MGFHSCWLPFLLEEPVLQKLQYFCCKSLWWLPTDQNTSILPFSKTASFVLQCTEGLDGWWRSWLKPGLDFKKKLGWQNGQSKAFCSTTTLSNPCHSSYRLGLVGAVVSNIQKVQGCLSPVFFRHVDCGVRLSSRLACLSLSRGSLALWDWNEGM